MSVSSNPSLRVDSDATNRETANLTCGECGETRPSVDFQDPSSSEPHCKECVAGFWEMMGDDPCGKGWRS